MVMKIPNANYIKGVRKERAQVNRAKARGCIAARSAGSHSPIDVWVVDHPGRTITLIQCKPDSMPNKEKNRIYERHKHLNGIYQVIFKVI